MPGFLIPFLFGAGGLTISTSSPDALCPPLAETERAVQARLGSIELEGPWNATYAMVHRVDGDYIELELRDPAGQRRLERAIPLRGESCATVAHVIALVIERFFERPAGAPDEQAPGVQDAPAEPVAPDAPPPPREVEAQVEPLAEPAAAQETVRAAAPSALRAGFGPMLWVSTLWVAPGLSIHLKLQDGWLAVVAIGQDLRRTEERVGSGTARSWRTPTSAFFGRALRAGSLEIAIGPELTAFHEYAKSQGLISENNSANRVVPGLGLRLELAPAAPRAPVRPFIAVAGHWVLRPLAPEFRVDGEEALRVPAAAGGVVLGVGWWP